MYILEDETLDDLQLKDLKLIQKKNGFRLCLDSVLLADFANIRPIDTVADLGTGTGVLLFLLWGRNKGKYFYGVEIQEELADIAERNTRLNHMENRITILHCDVSEVADTIQVHSIDTVICNPPYPFRKELNIVSSSREISRYQTEDCLDAFLSAAYRLLKNRGKLFMVYPAAWMFDLMTAMRNNHLEPKRFRLVFPSQQRSAFLVLIEAVKGGKPMLHPLSPLIVHMQDGSLTNELKSIYHMKE